MLGTRDITFPIPMFNCYLNYVTEVLRLLALFLTYFSSDLTKAIYNVVNNMLQDCLAQAESWSVP